MTSTVGVSKIRLSPQNSPTVFSVEPMNSRSVEAAERVLQHNHDEPHIFFSYMDKEGVHMHNHLVHHVLTLVAMGAKPEEVQHLYDINIPYQRPALPVNLETLKTLSNETVYKKSLGDENNYTSFLRFFENELAAKGIPGVLQEYIFAEDFKADDMFVRMFMGLIHPIIHLGFGIEFNQPAIVAEALAQAAVHSDNYFFTFLHELDGLASQPNTPQKPLAELVDLASSNEKCRKAANSAIFDKLLDGTLKNAKEEYYDLARQYQVGENELDLRTAELSNATAYIVAGAQRRNKAPRMDFFTMHPFNFSVFLGTVAKSTWVPEASKARLLTYLGRVALLVHISIGAPTLNMDIIRDYKPQLANGTWDDAIQRAKRHPDDGHAAKMIRAARFVEEISRPYEHRPEFRVKGKDFEKFAVAIVDTLNPLGGKAGPYGDESWIRGAGFDDAWDSVPPLA